MGGRGASSARPSQTRAQQSEWATRLQTALNGGSYNGDYSVRFDDGESGMTRLYYRGEQYMAVPNEEMTGSVNVPDYKVRREETREEMMRRVIKAQIAAAERPESARMYDLGPVRMTVNPIGDGRYSVDVNELGGNRGGTSRTALGRSLLTRKSVTWDKLLELAQASVDKAGNI